MPRLSRSMRLAVAVSFFVPLISGCESATDPHNEGLNTFWRATNGGAAASQFDGPARYSVDNVGTERAVFYLQSNQAGESFRIRRAGDHLMGVGKFGAGNTLRWGVERGTETVIATYSREVDRVRETFLARDGSLTVTSVSEGRIEGSFRFNAVLFSTQVGNSTTTTASSDAPTLIIEGTFAAGPL